MNSTIQYEDRQVILNPTTLFQRISVIKQSEEELQQFLTHDLSTYPLALFVENGMRKGTKSKELEDQNAVRVTSLSRVRYHDVLGVHCPALEVSRHRIQSVILREESILAACEKVKALTEELDIEVEIFIDDENVSPLDHLLKSWKSCLIKRKSLALAIRGCNVLLRNIRDEAYAITGDSKITFFNAIGDLYPYLLVLIEDGVKYLKVVSENEYEVLGTFNINPQSLRDLKIIDFIVKIASSCAELVSYNKIIFLDSLASNVALKKKLTDGIKLNSNNSVETLFLRHELFAYGTGSIFSCSTLPTELEKSWYENYSESTGLVGGVGCSLRGLTEATEQLSLDSLERPQRPSPLLLGLYTPDLQNLSTDQTAREFWISSIKPALQSGLTKQISQVTNVSAKEGLKLYLEMILERLDYLNMNPQSYGELCLRIILETMEHMKRETGLITMYEKRKQQENEDALKEFSERLDLIDSLEGDARQEEIITSMLAGNLFDWGSGETAALLASGKFGFTQAMERLPGKPWLRDDLASWSRRMVAGAAPRQAMVFCDNCGPDLILGVLPFVRELLKAGTKVIICVNKYPVLNDVTYYDLMVVMEQICQLCPIFKNSCSNEKLSFIELSKSSCCLDLRSVDEDIAEKMEEIDLLVIGGMGRAVLTNLEARFSTECLKVAVVKNRWLATRLGSPTGDFACIFKHDLLQ